MTRTNALVRRVLGAKRGSIRAFTEAVDCLIRHSFLVERPPEEVHLSVIYAEVADMLNLAPDTAATRIRRTALRCWEDGDRKELNSIIGKELEICPPPSEMLLYFAAYSHYGKPYREVIEEELAKLF